MSDRQQTRSLNIQNGRTKVYNSVSDEIMRYMPFKLEYLNGMKKIADILSPPPGNDSVMATQTKNIPLATDNPSLLQQAHNQAGHQSAYYTLHRLQKHFSWASMSADVNKYVKSCKVWAQAIPFRPRHAEPQSPRELPARQIMHSPLKKRVK